MFRTVAFRLTLWYAVLFAISSMAAFALAYFRLTSSIHERTDAMPSFSADAIRYEYPGHAAASVSNPDGRLG